jgi:hypothetical protein
VKKDYSSFVAFEILTALTMKHTIAWNISPRNPAGEFLPDYVSAYPRR